MKTVTLFLLGLICITTTTAQKVIEKNFQYKNQYINLDVKFANHIEVKTWDKNTVYFKANLNSNGNKYLNLYKLDIIEKTNAITITSQAKAVFKAFHNEWRNNNTGKRKYYVNGDEYEFNYILYVPRNAKFKISSINGDLKAEVIEGNFTADLINGNIDIKKYSGDLDLTTVNGEIDLTVENVNLVAKTVNGDIYASEKLDLVSEDRHVGSKVWSESSNAKNRLKLNTVNGNMYLR